MSKTDLTNQRQVFVEEYVRSGDHLEAAKKAGYKDTHTLRNQACKLRRECADEITEAATPSTAIRIMINRPK